MPVEFLFPQFENWTTNVVYPFSDSATLSNGTVVIPNNLFDDARLYLIGGSQGLYLSGIQVGTGAGDNIDNAVVTFEISDKDSDTTASGIYTAGTGQSNVVLFDEYQRPAGILVASAANLSLAPALFPIGMTLFEPNQTPFSPLVMIPMLEVGLRGVLLDDGNIISGDVYLVGTDGIVLSNQDGLIRVDIVGDPYAIAKAVLWLKNY
jgi:hypothetical protein